MIVVETRTFSLVDGNLYLFGAKSFPIYWSLKSEAGKLCADGLNEQNILCYDQLLCSQLCYFLRIL
jgi:hypothetical protein